MLATWVWLLLLVTSHARAQARAPLLVVEVAEADHAAAQRLLALMEQPTQLLRLPAAREPAQSLAIARAAGAERVVVFDGEAQRVVVLRSEDGASWLRTTSPDATPFVVAFLATELLRLSDGARANEIPSPPVPVPADDLGLTWLGLRVGFDALPGSPYRGALRPAVGVLAALSRPSSRVSLLLELSASARAQVEQAVPDARLRLRRSDLAARLGPVLEGERLSLSAFVSAGARVSGARYQGRDARDERHARFVAGIGVEPVLQVAPWLRVYLSCSLLLATAAVEYRAGPTQLLREPRHTLQVGAGLWLTLPI